MKILKFPRLDVTLDRFDRQMGVVEIRMKGNCTYVRLYVNASLIDSSLQKAVLCAFVIVCMSPEAVLPRRRFRREIVDDKRIESQGIFRLNSRERSAGSLKHAVVLYFAYDMRMPMYVLYRRLFVYACTYMFCACSLCIHVHTT